MIGIDNKWWKTHQSMKHECPKSTRRLHRHYMQATKYHVHLFMQAPDSLSRGFYRSYQIALTLSDISIEFTRAKRVHLHTLKG
jgi:hypothetical protein